MGRSRRLVLGQVLAVIAAAGVGSACGDGGHSTEEPVPARNEVLVKLRPAAVADSLFVPAVIAVEPMGYRWYRLILASDVDHAAVLHHLDRLDVEITQDNHRYVLDGMPNDPYFDQQYAHALTEAAAGWDVTTGATDIIAAVLDGGIDLSHVDLVDNLHVNQREEPGNGIDDDANGFVDDVHGWDFIDHDADPSLVDGDHHGTGVSGILGARGDNGVGVAGVAWRVSLMPLRLEANSAGIAMAVHYAVENGARVINLSMSSANGMRDAAVIEALDRAEDAGVVVVASAGNEGTDEPRYPAALPTVLSVGATDAHDQRASFSSFGDWVDVAAPGDCVHTTFPGSTYNCAGGTSYAAPYVAGVAALLLTLDPGRTPQEVRTIIRETTDTLGLAEPFGGRVNVRRALERGAAEPEPCGGD